jgi:hypothetical protein
MFDFFEISFDHSYYLKNEKSNIILFNIMYFKYKFEFLKYFE